MPQIVGTVTPGQRAIIQANVHNSPAARNHVGHEKVAGTSLLWTQREMGQIKADLNRGDYRAAASRARRLSRPRMTAAQVREQTTKAKQRLALRAEYLRLICIP